MYIIFVADCAVKFLRKNKNLAGVVGGLSVANVLTSSITK